MKALIVISALVLLEACGSIGMPAQRLEACGSRENGGFTGSTNLPATDEGNGWVGLMQTSWNDTGQNYEYFKLLQCKSGVALQGQYSGGFRGPLSAGAPPRPTQSLQEFLSDYSFDWERGNVDVSEQFLADMEDAHFSSVFARNTYAIDTWASGNSREVCACRHYYSDVSRDWPDKPQEQIDREARIDEILDEFIDGL